jgi:pyocin large subunit-like protein
VWTRVKVCFRWWRTFVWATPLTVGFANKRTLARHYVDHAADFGAKNAAEYEMLADKFLGGNLRAGVLECKRRKGDIIRFNPFTDEYGVLSKDRVIRTYFKPIPRQSLAGKVTRKCHNFPTNLAYFKAECQK